MSGADGLERKVLALERLLKAQECGLLAHSTIMTFDRRGRTKDGAALVLREELERRGLALEDFEAAGMDLIHVNLWWADGRNVRFGDRFVAKTATD